jgi:hypothetical protein
MHYVNAQVRREMNADRSRVERHGGVHVFGLCVWVGRVAHGRARVVVPCQCGVADPPLFSGTHMHGLHAHA